MKLRYVINRSPRKRKFDSGEMMVTCTICNVSLTKAEHSVASHLRKHVREKTLAREDMNQLIMKILGREFKKF